MATLSANKPRAYLLGNNNHIPVIASDIIYEGAAVGVVKTTGHARPLAAGDIFGGFSLEKADNASGSAADINVEVRKVGTVILSVAGAVITDIGQPVYATDDDTFTFIPTAAVFIGFVRTFESAGVVKVEFDADNYQDPFMVYGSPEEYETVSVNKTLDIEDCGKVLFVDTDAKVITLAAVVTPIEVTIVNIGAYGAILVAVSPNASDKIHAPDIAGTDDKDHLNTKATARRGDLVQISSGAGDAAGHVVRNQVGIWAQEA
jgi:hypothetical protein